MGEPANRRATYESLLEVSELLVAEIVGDVLRTHSRPTSLHARAASRLGAELDAPFDRGRGGPGGWIILDRPELRFESDIVVPDLAGWRRTRMPELPDAPAFKLAPDWICEVLSPPMHRAEKMAIYARENVVHVWLIDPIARTLEAFTLAVGRWVLLRTWRDDARVRVEPFADHEIALADLWAK